MKRDRSWIAAAAILWIGNAACTPSTSEPQGSVHLLAAKGALKPGDYDSAAAGRLAGGYSGTGATSSAGSGPGSAGSNQPGGTRPTAGTSGGGTMAAGAMGAAGRAGNGGTAGSGGSGTTLPGGGPSQGSLAIQFTSLDQRGRYSPRNIGAVWIETADGKFVKTVERWASTRARDLQRWNKQSGGWPSSAFGSTASKPDQVDAVSRATLRAHETHALTWNMHDTTGAVVPDGSYKVVVEVTDRDSPAGPYDGATFEKGPQAAQVTAPDAMPYRGMTLNYQP